MKKETEKMDQKKLQQTIIPGKSPVTDAFWKKRWSLSAPK